MQPNLELPIAVVSHSFLDMPSLRLHLAHIGRSWSFCQIPFVTEHLYFLRLKRFVSFKVLNVSNSIKIKVLRHPD